MRPSVRRFGIAALLIAWLQQPAAAEPATPDASYDPGAAVTAPAPSAPAIPPVTAAAAPPAGPAATLATSPASPPATPWIDQGASPVASAGAPVAEAPVADHRIASALTLGGVYVGFTTWTYFAWYRKHKPLDQFRWGGDGWLGLETYAGGADKFGHAWATMSLARLGTEVLHQWGGYSKLTATIVGTTLSELLFLGVEVKDGFYYEFSFSDAAFDTLGAVAGAALSLSPRLDELFDFRVEYWPSAAYRKQFDGGNVNVAEDYSGETYLLALHLGAFRGLREQSWGGWSRFVDVAAGFGTRGYKPDPPSRMLPDYEHHQNFYFGVSLNAQGLFDWLLDGRSAAGKKLSHGFFEVFNMPYGFLPVIEESRTPTGAIAGGGA
jgi:hypothetical protein